MFHGFIQKITLAQFFETWCSLITIVQIVYKACYNSADPVIAWVIALSFVVIFNVYVQKSFSPFT